MTATASPWAQRALAQDDTSRFWSDLAELANEVPGSIPMHNRAYELLRALNVFRTLVPKDLGGDEASPLDAMQLVEDLATLSGTVGWLSFVGATGGIFSVELPADGAHEVYADPNVLVAYAGGINGVLTRRGDGYVVSGNWNLASGLPHATWIAVGCRVAEDTDATAVALLPRADCESVFDWSPVGLSGTGTGRLAVADALVPHNLVAHDIRTDDENRRRRRYRVLIPSAMASVSIGIGGASIDHAARSLAQEPERPSDRRRRDSDQVQDLLGRAYARILAARCLLRDVTAEAWQKASSGEELGLELGARHRLAASHAAHTAADVAMDVARLLGVQAVTSGDPATQRWLDARVRTVQLRCVQDSAKAQSSR